MTEPPTLAELVPDPEARGHLVDRVRGWASEDGYSRADADHFLELAARRWPLALRRRGIAAEVLFQRTTAALRLHRWMTDLHQQFPQLLQAAMAEARRVGLEGEDLHQRLLAILSEHDPNGVADKKGFARGVLKNLAREECRGRKRRVDAEDAVALRNETADPTYPRTMPLRWRETLDLHRLLAIVLHEHVRTKLEDLPEPTPAQLNGVQA